MTTTYGANGFKPTSTTISGTNVTSLTIDLDNTTGISCVVGTLSCVTETNNFRYLVQLLDSSSVAINRRGRTTTNSTTSSWYSSGMSGSFAFTYWNMGALNSDSSVTGERLNFFAIIDNHLSNGSPYNTPHFLLYSCYRDNVGNIEIADHRAVCLENKNVAKLLFSPQAGGFTSYRIRTYNLFEA